MDEKVVPKEFMYDLQPNKNGNIELVIGHEGTVFVLEVTEDDVKSFASLFKLFKREAKKKNYIN